MPLADSKELGHVSGRQSQAFRCGCVRRGAHTRELKEIVSNHNARQTDAVLR
jgi:hypothetical protein